MNPKKKAFHGNRQKKNFSTLPKGAHISTAKGPHTSPSKQTRESAGSHEGTLFVSYGGTGFFDIPGSTESIRIPREQLHTALHGDTVHIHSYKKNRELYGEVTKIIKRKQLKFTGVLREEGGELFVIADNKRFYRPILIKDKTQKAHLNHKVYVKIVRWEKHDKDPLGEIVEVIGKRGDHETEINAILLEKGFVKKFEEPLMHEAHGLKKEIVPEQIALRRDFRTTPTFTIDPVDAKDFDDAISIKEDKNGMYEIGVHIADVSHYVTPGTILDDEARERSTSVYMVDRTIPMLPEILSNDLCSLKEGVDRLTMSAVFLMDKKGTVHSRWFGKTVIHSQKRFTYENAQEVIDTGKGPFAKELKFLEDMTNELGKTRKREGALSFNQAEVRFVLDKDMKPTDVYAKIRTPSHDIIEELMILANNEVAHFIANYGKKNTPTIYRVHGTPKKDKIEDLKAFLKIWGYSLTFSNTKSLSYALNKLQDEMLGTPEQTMVTSMIIRSMEKAVYSTKNIGHYGLALKEYVHFTSPIRRYPDLIVHRTLDNLLKNKKPESEKKLGEISLYASNREKEAADAERASIKFKQVEYMTDRLGERFEGVISGMNDYTIYIEEIRTKCEGFVPINDIKGDTFMFDKQKMQVIGTKTKRGYRLGDTVAIRVKATDLDEKTITYEISD